MCTLLFLHVSPSYIQHKYNAILGATASTLAPCAQKSFRVRGSNDGRRMNPLRLHWPVAPSLKPFALCICW